MRVKREKKDNTNIATEREEEGKNKVRDVRRFLVEFRRPTRISKTTRLTVTHPDGIDEDGISEGEIFQNRQLQPWRARTLMILDLSIFLWMGIRVRSR